MLVSVAGRAASVAGSAARGTRVFVSVAGRATSVAGSAARGTCVLVSATGSAASVPRSTGDMRAPFALPLLQEARGSERSKARADQTLLAKEIKRLREELAAQLRVSWLRRLRQGHDLRDAPPHSPTTSSNWLGFSCLCLPAVEEVVAQLLFEMGAGLMGHFGARLPGSNHFRPQPLASRIVL
eukprot:scaffold56510_cov21-Tisochrysis_lutea.AAC.1